MVSNKIKGSVFLKAILLFKILFLLPIKLNDNRSLKSSFWDKVFKIKEKESQERRRKLPQWNNMNEAIHVTPTQD